MNIEQIAGQQAHLRAEMLRLDKHIEELKQAQAKPAPGPAPAEVKARLERAGATVMVVADRARGHGEHRATVYSNAVDVHIEQLTPDRAEAALLAARGDVAFCKTCPVNEGVGRIEAQLATKDIELAEAKAERDTAKRRVDEDEAEIERIRRGEAALTKSRDMWKRAATENAAEIERLRERSAAQGREFEQADAIVARLRGEAKEARMLLRLAKAPFLDDAWEARREAWLARNQAGGQDRKEQR